MSQPSPLVIEFVTKGLDDVLKGLKTISDAVNKNEQKSAATTKKASKARLSEAEKEARDMKAIRERSATMAGSFAKKEADADIRERKRSESYKKAVRERSATMAGSFAKKEADAEIKERDRAERHKKSVRDRSATMAGAFAKKEADAEIKERGRAETFKKNLRERSASMAGSYAKKEANEEIKVRKQLLAERRKTELAIVRGEIGSIPRLSPRARLQILNDAIGRTAEHQRLAIAKTRDMAAENKAMGGPKKAALQKELVDHAWIEKQMTKQTEDEENRRLRIRERSATMAGKFAAKQAREEASKREQFTDNIKGGAGRAFRNASIGATVAGGLAFRTVTGLGGGFSVQDSLQEQVNFEREATRLATKSGTNGERTITSTEAQQALRTASVQSGTDRNEVLRGVTAYGDKSGNWKDALAQATFIAKYAKVSGSDIGESGKLMGSLKYTNDTMSNEDVQRLMLDTLAQGREGNVDMAELVSQAGKITSTASIYKGNREDNQRKLLTLAQLGGKGGVAAGELGTSITNLGLDAQDHQKDLKVLLGDSAIKDGRLQMDPEQLLLSIMDKTKGDTSRIKSSGMMRRSMKMFLAAGSIYEPAKEKALAEGASKEEAHQAGMKSLSGFLANVDKQSITPESLEKDFAEIMRSSAEQFEQAVRQLKTEVGEKLIPELTKLIPVLQELTPHLVKFLQGVTELAAWAAKNPIPAAILGLGAAISKEVLAQIISAKIGDLIKGLLNATAGGGAGGAGGGVGVPGALAAAVAAGGVVVNSAVGFQGGVEGAQDLAAKVDAWKRGDRKNGVSPEQAKKTMDEAQKRYQEAGAFEQAANIITSPFVESSSKAYKQYKADQGMTQSDEGKALMKQLVEALQQNTNATKANSAASGGTSTGPAKPPNPKEPIGPRRP